MSHQVAFAGDIHDDQTYIDHLLHTLEMRSIDTLYLLGDITTAETLEQFARHDVGLVFGNADHDTIADLCQQAERQGATVHGDSARLTFGGEAGTTIIARHGLDPRSMAYAMAAHNCDYVVHGHYHSEERTQTGSGEVLSYGLGCLIYDPATDEFEQITYEDVS